MLDCSIVQLNMQSWHRESLWTERAGAKGSWIESALFLFEVIDSAVMLSLSDEVLGTTGNV